jgi:hypothetical protein
MAKKNEIQKRQQGKPAKPSLNLTTTGLNSFRKATSSLELPRLFYQLVIFVIDGSRSMRQPAMNFPSKAQGIDDAIKRVLDRLRSSKNARSFDIGMYVFSDEFKRVFEAKSLADISPEQSFNPHRLIDAPGETMLEDCLIDVKSLVREYLTRHAEKNARALVLLLSDGVIDDYEQSLEIAREMMNDSKVTFASMYMERAIDDCGEYFAWNEGTNTIDYSRPVSVEEVKRRDNLRAEKFRAFASMPDLSQSTLDPDEIRKHMVKSISMVSKI